MPDESPVCHVGVARAELAEALRILRRVTAKKDPPEALVRVEGRELVIQLGGTTVRATAWGRWHGVVRAPGHFVANLDRSLPEADPVPVRVRGGRLKIGPLGVPCAWQEEAPESVRVPLDPGLLHLLRLPLEHDPLEIVEAGLERVVADAVTRRDALLERAARALEPLEITRDDLLACVEARIRAKFERK